MYIYAFFRFFLQHARKAFGAFVPTCAPPDVGTSGEIERSCFVRRSVSIRAEGGGRGTDGDPGVGKRRANSTLPVYLTTNRSGALPARSSQSRVEKKSRDRVTERSCERCNRIRGTLSAPGLDGMDRLDSVAVRLEEGNGV